MEFFKKYILPVLIFGGIIFAGWKAFDWFIDKTVAERTAMIIPDTKVVERIKTVQQRDTIIKWYEKPLYKEVKPTVIFVQSDSTIREELKDKDLIINLEKDGDKIRMFAHNDNDSTVKEYVFDGVGRDFSATAMTGNIMIKSQRFYWEGLNLSVDVGLKLSDLNNFKTINFYDKNIYLTTGWNYNERLGLEVGGKYNFNTNNYSLYTKLNFKLIK